MAECHCGQANCEHCMAPLRQEIPVARAAKSAEEEALRRALRDCLDAMKKSQDEGCTDHLDCADDGGSFWYDAIAQAEGLLR